MKIMFSIVLALLISSGLRANAGARFVLAESENFIVLCINSPTCSATAPPEVVAQREVIAATVAQEADRILAWFGSLEYPELQLNIMRGKFVITI